MSTLISLVAQPWDFGRTTSGLWTLAIHIPIYDRMHREDGKKHDTTINSGRDNKDRIHILSSGECRYSSVLRLSRALDACSSQIADRMHGADGKKIVVMIQQ
jgi:hypothetical protein